MTDFKRGDKVQWRQFDFEDFTDGEFIGPCGEYVCVSDGRSDEVVLVDRKNVRRARRVIKQMCQWWLINNNFLRAYPADIVEMESRNYRKVGEPFEQTLEIPE